MNKRLWKLMILALGTVLLTSGLAGAAKYPNLAGTNWAGTAISVYWDGSYHNETVPVSLAVAGQDTNGMFYGTLTYNGFEDKMTGSIATNKTMTITIYAESGAVGILTGKLSGKTITGTENFFTNSAIYAVKITMKKQ